MSRITDIFFDLDHTLWDFEPNSDAAFEKLLKQHNINVSIVDFIETYRPINHQYWDNYSRGIVTKAQVRKGRLIDTFEKLSATVSDEMIERLADDYLIFLREETRLFQGAISLLEYLQEKYKLHILTNGFNEVQSHKLKNAKIDFFFKTVTTSEEAGKLKPHPDIFNYALKKADVFAQHSVMIGDNLKTDILGAKNVGMFVIHFDPEQQNNIDREIIPKVNHLLQIKEIL